MPHMQSICTILGYHEVGPRPPGSRERYIVTPGAFARQLAELQDADGCCVTLQQLEQALTGRCSLPARAFAITFDDGYTGVYEHALPMLVSVGYTATLFACSRLLGERGQDHDPGPVAKMTAEQLRQWISAGQSVGAHTRTHVDLVAVDGHVAREEITLSRLELENELDGPVPAFCYPYGRYDSNTVNIVREAGYSLACTTKHGAVSIGQDLFQLHRLMVREHTTLSNVFEGGAEGVEG